MVNMNLLQEIMDVEHLWKFNEAEINKLNQNQVSANESSRSDGAGASSTLAANPLLAGLANSEDTSPDLIANLCNVADHRLYKIVKWCKSLPLFKNISVSTHFNSKKTEISFWANNKPISKQNGRFRFEY